MADSPLDPDAIARKTFLAGFRGYEQQEVRAYLHDLAQQARRLQQRLADAERRLAELEPLVADGLVGDRDVVARREVLAVGLQHDHPYITVGRRHRPGLVHLIERLLIDGVGLLGPVQGDDPHRSVDLIDDVFHGSPRAVGPRSVVLPASPIARVAARSSSIESTWRVSKLAPSSQGAMKV